MDLATFKVKGKSFLFNVSQFTDSPYTVVCMECRGKLKDSCKRHKKDKYVACPKCGLLCCWKTWRKSHSDTCRITEAAYYKDVLELRGKQTRPATAARLASGPKTFIPKDIINKSTQNRFGQVFSDVSTLQDLVVDKAIPFCRMCFLCLSSHFEMCPEHCGTKKYADMNKYMCGTCGQHMSYSTLKRHYRNNACRHQHQHKDTIIHHPSHLHPLVQEYAIDLQDLGSDVMRVLSDLSQYYPEEMKQYLTSLRKYATRFHPLLHIKLDLNAMNDKDILHALTMEQTPPIFEPLSPISMSDCSSISDKVNENGIPTFKQLQDLFVEQEMSIDTASTISSCTDVPMGGQDELSQALLETLEELVIMTTSYYDVYSLFVDTMGSIRENHFNKTRINDTLIDLNAILEHRSHDPAVRVIASVFGLGHELEVMEGLQHHKSTLESQLVALDVFESLLEERLGIIDLAVGKHVYTATKMVHQIQDALAIRSTELINH